MHVAKLQAEVIFLGQLRHPHLVKLIGYCCEDEERLLVYEFMSRGSLENHLFKRKFMQPLTVVLDVQNHGTYDCPVDKTILIKSFQNIFATSQLWMAANCAKSIIGPVGPRDLIKIQSGV